MTRAAAALYLVFVVTFCREVRVGQEVTVGTPLRAYVNPPASAAPVYTLPSLAWPVADRLPRGSVVTWYWGVDSERDEAGNRYALVTWQRGGGTQTGWLLIERPALSIELVSVDFEGIKE